MISVNVDGKPLEAPLDEIKTMGDLVELVKATIDPDSIITELQLDDRPLLDSDWRVPLSVHAESTLEISTGDKNAYVRDRLLAADSYLEKIIGSFAKASESYAARANEDANQLFKAAIDDLLAFVNWYVGLLAVFENENQAELIGYEQHIKNIQGTCEQMLQQQMFQSWSMLGETLEKRLAPELAALRSFCEETSKNLAVRLS